LQIEDHDVNVVLNQLEMKRTWESGNHPYLFFNEDGDTFTPLGFFVQLTGGAMPLISQQSFDVKMITQNEMQVAFRFQKLFNIFSFCL